MPTSIVAEPTPYYHKQPMRYRDYEIYYNHDTRVTHILRNRHDYYELYFLLEGQVRYVVDEQVYYLQPGDMLLIPPEVWHEAQILSAEEGYRRYVLWLDKSFLERLSSMKSSLVAPFQKSYLGQAGLRLTGDLRQETARRLQNIYLSSQSEEFASDLMGTAEIIALLVRISRAKLFQGSLEPLDRSADQGSLESQEALLRTVLNYIERHITESISLRGLCEHFFISRSRLSKLFSDELGLGPAAYIRKKRFYLMRQALETGRSIRQVLEQFQITNYSSFYRGFKAEFGLGPKEFLLGRMREQHSKAEAKAHFGKPVPTRTQAQENPPEA